MNILFLSIVCSALFTTYTSYSMQSINKDTVQKSISTQSFHTDEDGWQVYTSRTGTPNHELLYSSTVESEVPQIDEMVHEADDTTKSHISLLQNSNSYSDFKIAHQLSSTAYRQDIIASSSRLQSLIVLNLQQTANQISENLSLKNSDSSSVESQSARTNCSPINDTDNHSVTLSGIQRSHLSSLSVDSQSISSGSSSRSTSSNDLNSHHNDPEVLALLTTNRSRKFSQSDTSPSNNNKSPEANPISSSLGGNFNTFLTMCDNLIKDFVETISDDR